jgi:two-component system OmpR family sensor kinase
VLRDTAGVVLDRAGACARQDFTVQVPGRGVLSVCAARHRFGVPWRLGLALLVAVAVLWGASGRIARRIARPIVHLAGVARDLGDGKLASRARLDRRALGEIGTLTTAINDMAGKIERQMRDQRELLATVSHELRTPLGRIRVIGDLLASSADPVRLAQLEREVLEMDRLVGELLASARVDFSALTPTRLDAAALAATALERLHQPAGRLHVDTQSRHVEADATLLLRAISNLIDNAERHGKGLVRLSLRSRPGHLVFEAEDAGPGFTEAEMARAFEPFQRRGAGDDDGRSLGLGLSLVRRIAEAHHGTAFVRNGAAGGAVVGIELPSVRPG